MTEKYFASANGYSGFRSYFDSVFTEEDLTRLYILKGGPGTGKSTLMKRISSEFRDLTDKCELILCSSDPESLDGVILTTKAGRIAITDGTAPHVLDTQFPGAISEIINLGEGWDSTGLCTKREEITKLIIQKKAAYKQAYEMLEVAGRTKARYLSIIGEHFDRNRAVTAAKILLSENNRYKEKMSIRLLESFGKSGRIFLPAPEGCETITICGKYHSADLYLLVIKEVAENSGYIKTVIPSVLNEYFYHGIITDTKSYLISDEGISADEFLSDFTPSEVNELQTLDTIHENLLALAKEHFSIASDKHFLLEKIYSSLMEYTVNDEVENRLKKEIKAFLNL